MKKQVTSNPRRGRPSSEASALPRLKRLGLFRADSAKSVGVSQSTLSRWVAAGKIDRVTAGLYCHPETQIDPEERGFAIAAAVFGPAAVIGGMTALFHYGLIEQVPSRIWVMVPKQVRTKDPLYRLVRTQTNPTIGIENHGLYRMTNLERTLVEAFRLSTKIGLRIALRATRTALAHKRTNLQKILRQAKALGMVRVIERHWESIVPESEAA